MDQLQLAILNLSVAECDRTGMGTLRVIDRRNDPGVDFPDALQRSHKAFTGQVLASLPGALLEDDGASPTNIGPVADRGIRGIFGYDLVLQLATRGHNGRKGGRRVDVYRKNDV